MPHRSGMVEIRLEKRQAFYAFVGCMLIVSVAFVVGVIVGQRMQLDDFTAHLGGLSPTAVTDAEDQHLVAVALAEQPVDDTEGEAFTFYDELAVAAPRPSPDLSSNGGGSRIEPTPDQEPEIRSLGRVGQQPEAVPQTSASSRVAELAAEAPPAAPEQPPVVSAPPSEVAPAPPAHEPDELVDRGADPADSDGRRLQRRTVRRLAPDDALGTPQDFGYFTVEVGRFGSFDEANALRSRLRADGHDAIVTLLGRNAEHRYRVQVGSFTRRSDATTTAATLDGTVIQEG